MATLEKIYKEIKALRRELAVLIPRESLAAYANPKKIISAYQRAIAQYPNRSSANAGN